MGNRRLHRVSQNCAEKGVLAASLFFNRQDKDRSSSKNFVATIAYQLTASVPSLKHPILDAFKQDDTILDTVMENQFQKLVIQPLRLLPESDSPLVIVIDALDECKDSVCITDLLALLSHPNSSLRFPLRIFITTRPKHYIRAALLTTGLPVSSSNLEPPKHRVKHSLLHPLLYRFTCVSLCLTPIIAFLWVRVSPFFIWVTPTACLLTLVYHGTIFGIDYYRKSQSDVRALTASATATSLACVFLLDLFWMASLVIIIYNTVIAEIPLGWGVAKSILNVIEVAILGAIMIWSGLERKQSGESRSVIGDL